MELELPPFLLLCFGICFLLAEFNLLSTLECLDPQFETSSMILNSSVFLDRKTLLANLELFVETDGGGTVLFDNAILLFKSS